MRTILGLALFVLAPACSREDSDGAPDVPDVPGEDAGSDTDGSPDHGPDGVPTTCGSDTGCGPGYGCIYAQGCPPPSAGCAPNEICDAIALTWCGCDDRTFGSGGCGPEHPWAYRGACEDAGTSPD